MSNLSQTPSEMNQTSFAEHYRCAVDSLLDCLVPRMSLEWYGETFTYAFNQAIVAVQLGTNKIEIELAQSLARDICKAALEYGVRVTGTRRRKP